MKTWLKSIGILIALLASCLLIFVVCLFSYANSDHFRNVLLKKINASIAGQLSIAGHDISFLSGRVVLEKPALKSRFGQKLVSLDHLMVDVAFLPLLKRAIVIEAMTLRNPDIRLSIDRDGRVDIVEVFQTTATERVVPEPKKQGRPFVVIARQIAITDGRFYFIDDVKNLEGDLNRITVQAQVDLFKKTGEIRLGVANTVLAFDERRLKIQPLTLSLVRSKGRPMSVALEGKTDFADIGLSGTAQPVLHDPELNLKLSFGCSLVELNQLLKLPVALTGKATGELSVAGDWRDPEADLRLAYHGGSLAGYRVDKLKTRANLKNRLVTIGQLDILTGPGEISLTGQAGLQDVFPEGFGSAQMDMDRLVYDIHAALKHIDMAWLGKGTDLFKGTVRAEADLKGEGVDAKELAASGVVDLFLEQYFQKGMGHPTDMHIQASGKAEAGVIDLNRLTLAAAETRFDGTGAFDTTSGEIQGRLKAETEDIGSLLSLFKVSGGAGACTVKVDVIGPWRQPEVGIDIMGQEIRFRETRIGDVDLSANLDPSGLLNVTGLNLSNQGTRVRGNGTIQLLKEGMQLHETMPLQAELQVTGGEVYDFVENQSVKGSFEGEIKLDGTIGSLEAVASLRGKALAYENIRLGEVDAKARFLNGELLLDRFQLRNSETRCLVSGGVRAFEPGSWTRLADPVLSLDVAGDVASIVAYIPDIQGSLTLDAHLEGPLSNLKGKGNIQADHLDIYGQGLEGILLDIDLRENRLHLPVLRASLDSKSIVAGSGWIDLDQRFSFEILSNDLQLNSIRKIRELNSVEGAMDFRVRGEGNIETPSIEGNIRIKEIQINQQKMDDFNFRIDLADNQLAIKGQQTFELDLAYHLLEKNFNIDVYFSNTDLTPFFLTTGIKDFGGKLSGEIVAKGNTGSLKKSEAVLDISNLSLTYREEPFAGADSIRAQLKNQRVSIPEFQMNFLKSGVLRINGAGDFKGDLDVTANGNIPANFAKLFLKDVVDIEGDIHLQAQMKGSVAEPGWSGEIVFQDVGFALPQLEPAFKGVNGKIVLKPSQVSIENVHGKLEPGIFRLNGDIFLEKFRPDRIAVELKGDRLPVIVSETMDALLATDLSAEGTLDRILIEGDIVILEGLYHKDFKVNLLQKMKEKKRPEAPPAGENGASFLDRIAVDIKLKYREPFIVDNNIAYLEIQPDLVISGTLQTPVVSGVAKVAEGTISYQKKSFVVEKGIIGFVNPYKIEAEIDIVGSVKVRQWQISLELSGTPDRLEVDLSSIPQEDDADILSLLVFGKTTNEMSGTSNGALDSTEALMARLIASSFGEDIKEATGLDYLEVETENEEMEDESDTVKVTVGKDLTERLSVKYTIGSGGDGYDQRAATEYKLLEHILLGGFQDIKGSYGGEIILRFEFR